MQNIALPKKIEFLKGEQANQEAIVIEPLYPGYGMTLGNSLRRVLLSSLPGAAVTGVKIKGVSHEFMALPHIKEDVLELILNLKQLRLRVFSEEEIKLELKVKGKKKVTAADIKGSEVEIKNPDLVLATITDEAGSLEMEIYVKEGRGYKMSEGDKKENKDINFMEIDSIFSPVLSVSIDVENARVGKMTNWDKLVLNVKTDGTISPRDAFEESVKILVEQFSSLLAPAKTDEEEPEMTSDMILEEAPIVESEEEIELAPKKAKKEKEAKPKKTKK
ncbi:MAG: DNA-directed RNA polymerase subunit alpha [Patescibacteria group bacterium]